jgi:hypothetical protein
MTTEQKSEKLKQYFLDEGEVELIELRRKNIATEKLRKEQDVMREKCYKAYRTSSGISIDTLFKMWRQNNNAPGLDELILEMKDFICGLELDCDYNTKDIVNFVYRINKCLATNGITQRITDVRYQGSSRYRASGYFLCPGDKDFVYE